MILSTNAYDPNEDEGRSRPKHITKRDLIAASVIVAVLILALWPVWVKLKEQRDKHVCKDNLSQISKAMFIYAENNSGRLPPAYVWGDAAEPRMFDGRANTWMSLLADSVKDPLNAFKCPSADEKELAPNAIPGGGTAMSGYGMFAALSAASTDYVPDTTSQAMIAETADLGSNGTFDPSPLKDPSGKPVHDGYIVGFDTSNFLPIDSSPDFFAKAKWATRLAFKGTSQGVFKAETLGRHEGGIHVLFLDGHVETLPATAATIRRVSGPGSEIIKAWRVR